jgi:ABC-type branched-subunit amino acid transport system substrate-binding protein
VVIPIEKKKRILICLVLVAAVAVFTAGYMMTHAPVRVGVLLDMTGDVDLREPLEWAKENINSQGGIGGRPLELVYRDTATGNTTEMAKELLADPGIRIVIGPPTSDDVYTLAPEFIRQNKLLISPLTTSGDIFRAFGRKGYVWRTSQGDVAQVKTILSILKSRGVKRAALLAEKSKYGQTFYEWTGFFSTEYGLDLVSIRQFDKGSSTLDQDVHDALLQNPEYIIAAAGPADAAEIKRALDRSGSPAKLFLADAAATPALISALGEAADGIEGTSPTADPGTGFFEAYEQKFGHPPTDYAAPAYDALLLAAYTTARQDASLFESPPDSIRKVVYGNGTEYGWNATEAHAAIEAFRSGKTASVTGTSGPLDYDSEFGVDPLVTYYSRWIIENSTFRTADVIGSAKTGYGDSGESAARARASAGFMSTASSGTSAPANLPPRTDFMAVIVGPSSGWENYRHQSDALAVYSLLRSRGVDDDHIILMSYDDIPTLKENPLTGNIHNTPKGQNIRSGAILDYSGPVVTASTLKNVLTGKKTASTPVVLESGPGTDIFVYIASHGVPGAITFSRQDRFTRDDLTNVTDTMSQNRQYRQLVFVVDTCFGESVATGVTAPGILYLTGAASNEPSLGAVYDMDIRQWLSDEFSANVVNLIRADPDITFRELYTAAYEKVTGSHVRMIATGNFTIDQPVGGFLEP